MPTVYFVKEGRAIECPVGTNLRDLARENGIQLYVFPHNLGHCRGFGLCGTCRVKIDEPRAVSPRTGKDEWKCAWEGEHIRLACQTKVLADLKVYTTPRKILAWTNHGTYEWMKELE
ncbi:MAG TPA: 2Fe-2S iron-sulfur cluster-binding protein [Terriglobales bacterium]|nr:2Fe-2S iron-sulfur cluster-binding protein [Terriglobales bacterium]